MDGAEMEPTAPSDEAWPSPHEPDIDAYGEPQIDQQDPELAENEKRNEFISALKDTTDLQEIVQRANATHLMSAAQALARAGITTANDLMGMARTDVCNKARITNEVYQSLLQHASMPFLPQMYAASEWREQQNVRLSLGSAPLDTFLGGGLRPYGITELAGEAGAGKSQICMQLCATVQLPPSLGGLEGGALYISTEGPFPQRRFVQIVEAVKQRHPEMASHDFLARVVLEQAPDAQRLLEILSTSARVIINRYNVRLLVVDSVAAVFREFGNEEMVERAKLMWRIAQQLKFIADGGGGSRVLVFVTNQVSARLDGPEARLTLSGDARPVPALGLAWASSVNTRLVARRTAHKADLAPPPRPSPQRRQGGDPQAEQASASANASVGAKRRAEQPLEEEAARLPHSPQTGLPVRELSVGFAPHLPRSAGADSCGYFVVERAGVTGVEPPSLLTGRAY